MFKCVKRDKEFSVKELNNGFIVTLGGRDNDNNWITDEVYVDSTESLTETIEYIVSSIEIDK